MNGPETEKDKLGNGGHVKGADNVIERRLEVRYCEGKKLKTRERISDVRLP